MTGAEGGRADEVFVRAPDPIRVRVEYSVEHQIGRWRWTMRRRRTYSFEAMPFYRLQALEMVFDDLRARRGGALTLQDGVAALIGGEAFRMPLPALRALWDAFAMQNYLPKAEAPARTAQAAADPPPTDRSSDDSSRHPSTTASDASTA